MTTLLSDLGDALFTPEGGGWLTLRRRALALRGLTAAELLRRTRELPGNVRYAIDADGPYLIEEVRGPDGLTLGAAGELFFGLLDRAAEPAAPSEEAIEAALDGSGLAWSRRAAGWSVVVPGRQPREVLVSAAPGCARAAATLTDWDEVAATCE